MADFSNIENQIDNAITTNGVGAITGAILNAILKGMLSAVDAAKQDVLVFDTTPTEDSVKPVTSGGVYDALAAAAQDVATTLANYYTKTEADTLLAAKADDADVVHLTGNETIAGTKTFSGGLDVQNTGISMNGTKVEDLGTPSNDSDAATKKYVDDGLATKQDAIADLDTIRSGAAAGATAVQPATMQAELAQKQDTLTFDAAPTDGSDNPVTSNGVYDALASQQATIDNTDEVAARSLNDLNARVDGILAALQNGLPYLRVEELVIARRLDAYIADGNFYVSGSGAPSILPQFNGQEYFDTTNNVWYKASFTGVAPTAADWKQITN